MSAFIDSENLPNELTKTVASHEATSVISSLSNNKIDNNQPEQQVPPPLLTAKKVSPPPRDITLHQETHIQMQPMDTFMKVERPSSFNQYKSMVFN